MDKKIITREEAKALGLKLYFTGKPCKRGHVADRYVSSATCVDCTRINNSEYHAEKREDIHRRKSKYRLYNHEKVRHGEIKYRAENPDKVRESDRKRYTNKIAEYKALMAELNEETYGETK